MGAKNGLTRPTNLLLQVFDKLVVRIPGLNNLLKKYNRITVDSYAYQHAKKLATLLDCIIQPETTKKPEYCPSIIGKPFTKHMLFLNFQKKLKVIWIFRSTALPLTYDWL